MRSRGGAGPLPAVDRAGLIEVGLLGVPFGGVEEEIGERTIHDVVVILIAEDPGQRRIHILEAAVKGRQINAFLERLEEFGESGLALALAGDIARQHADTHVLPLAGQGMQGALEEARGAVVLEADANYSGPMALFMKRASPRRWTARPHTCDPEIARGLPTRSANGWPRRAQSCGWQL